MTEQKLLTVREVSSILGVTEREVLDLAEDGNIPAYKIGGLYLRFKREQVEEYRKKLKHEKTLSLQKYTIGEKISDFFYYNDFYIFSTLLILIMLYIIFKG